MEGNTHLLQVIRKMRSQINKLERENRALKGELRGCGQPALPARGDGSGGARRWEPARAAEGPAASPASTASLQGGAAAAPAPGEQTDTAMTVRRYPTATPGAPAPSSTRSHWAGRQPPSTGLLEVPGSAQPPAPPAAAQLSREQQEGLGKSPASCLSYGHPSNVKLFQEHVYKCQALNGDFSAQLQNANQTHEEEGRRSRKKKPRTAPCALHLASIHNILKNPKPKFLTKGKVKAVSFLLPTDMSSFAEKQGSLKSPQNQSTKHLMTITEKDM